MKRGRTAGSKRGRPEVEDGEVGAKTLKVGQEKELGRMVTSRERSELRLVEGENVVSKVG